MWGEEDEGIEAGLCVDRTVSTEAMWGEEDDGADAPVQPEHRRVDVDVTELDQGLEPDEYVEHGAAAVVAAAAVVGPDPCPVKHDLLAASVGLMKANKTASKKFLCFHLFVLKGRSYMTSHKFYPWRPELPSEKEQNSK